MPKKTKPELLTGLGNEVNFATALLMLQRRLNQLERKMDQFHEDTASMIEDLYDTVKCHREVDHG